MFITRYLEYHVRDGVCVAVRDRRGLGFTHGHVALNQPLAGGLRLDDGAGREMHAGEPQVGDALVFASRSIRLLTAAVEAVERPRREVAALYSRS